MCRFRLVPFERSLYTYIAYNFSSSKPIVHWRPENSFFFCVYIKRNQEHKIMSLVTGQVVYASLAQPSVKGAMDAKLSQLSVGMLDVFSSAFWTHPAFAHSVIRNCDEELSFTKDAAGVRLFQPPRSMDVVYNMFAVVDLPGIVNVAMYKGHQYEIVSDDSMIRGYTAKIVNDPFGYYGNMLDPSGDSGLEALLAEFKGMSGFKVLRMKTTDGDIFHVTKIQSDEPGTNLFYIVGDADDGVDNHQHQPFGFITEEGGKTISFKQSGAYAADLGFKISIESIGQTHEVLGNPFMKAAHMPHYVDAVGQYLIQDVEMTIGGARVAFLNSMYMYIHEELFGMPGRRQQDAIGKTGELYEPEQANDAGTDDLEKKSMGARRLYVQLPFWWTGGKMERALKTIALQLHKIEFKITTRRLADCIAYASFSTERLPKAAVSGPFFEAESGTEIQPSQLSITTYVRKNEHISASVNDHLIGPVRKNASGGTL